MRKSKNRCFYHISVSSGDAHGAITLNVVWMEREFDAYKLSRSMYPSNYNRFWDRAIYLWKKSSFYHTPLAFDAFDAPVRGRSRRNISTPSGMEKLGGANRWWKNFEDTFIRFDVIHERDGRTDTAWQQRPRLCIASRGKNNLLPCQAACVFAYVSNLEGCGWVPALANLLRHQQCQLPTVCTVILHYL